MTPPPFWIQSLFVFVLGLEFGSFANVCIYRWPRSASVSSPRRSFCPWCNHQISWIENVPVLSFLFLRGRCRHCASPISARYPLVELSMALLWLGIFQVLGPAQSASDFVRLAAAFTFLFVAVVTTMTDLDWRIIPDEASATLALVGLLTSVANGHLGATPRARIVGSVIGLAVGAGVIWGVGAVGSRAFGREAMGGGDVKLLGAVGTVLGWDGAVFTLFLGAFLGGVISILALVRGRLRRNHYIPFGPFLNAAGIFLLFYLSSRRDLLRLLEMLRP